MFWRNKSVWIFLFAETLRLSDKQHFYLSVCWKSTMLIIIKDILNVQLNETFSQFGARPKTKKTNSSSFSSKDFSTCCTNNKLSHRNFSLLCHKNDFGWISGNELWKMSIPIHFAHAHSLWIVIIITHQEHRLPRVLYLSPTPASQSRSAQTLWTLVLIKLLNCIPPRLQPIQVSPFSHLLQMSDHIMRRATR